MIYFIYLAAFTLAMIILANFIAPSKLNYSDDIRKVSTFFGQVFKVHGAYTVLTLTGMMLLCIFFPEELLIAEPLTIYLCGFIAVFWGSRVLVQLFYYDAAIKQRYPIYNVLFLSAFLYLGGFFTFLTIYLITR